MAEPIRPSAHILEDISRDTVKGIFHRAGWVISDISPDYGEDELVFIYENGRATGELFFVQLKSVASDRYYSKSYDSIYYPLKIASLRRWERLSLPLVLIIYVYNKDECYWLVIQSYLSEKGANLAHTHSKTMSIHIPLQNVLTSDTALPLRRAVSDLLRPLAKQELTTLKKVLKNIEYQFDIINSWTDEIRSVKQGFDEALNQHEKKQISMLPSVYKGFGGVHYADPERSRLLQIMQRMIKKVPRKKMAEVALELQQTDPQLSLLQAMLLERYTDKGIYLLVSQMGQLQLLLATVGNGLHGVLQSDLTNAQWDAQEIYQDVEKGRDIIEKMKWTALDLI